MSKIQIGDLFSIQTLKGLAYFQYVQSSKKTMGEIIRILHGLFVEQPNDFQKIINAKELFFVHFPLKFALKKGIVSFIGNFNLPNDLQIPKFMRDKNVDRNKNLIDWDIVNVDTWMIEKVKSLSEEQKQLSPWGIWNDTLLIERLREGWTLEKW